MGACDVKGERRYRLNMAVKKLQPLHHDHCSFCKDRFMEV